MRSLQVELDNVMAACRCAVLRRDGEAAVATAVAAWEVLSMRGPLSAAVRLAEEVASIPGLSDRNRARVLCCQAAAVSLNGSVVDVLPRYEEALAIHRRHGHRRGEAGVLNLIGSYACE